MNSFELSRNADFENGKEMDAITALIEEFPEELQERIENEIANLDPAAAREYVMHKLIARKEAVKMWSTDKLPSNIEVTHEIPLAVLSSIEQTMKSEDTSLLGMGKNGKVYESIRRPYACYKVLFQEKAKQMNIRIVREAVMQYKMGEFLTSRDSKVRIPEVIGFVEHAELQAILMEKVEGSSLYDIFTGKSQLPPNFNAEKFFSQLEEAVSLLNEYGYIHGDLNNNAGNVMVDTDGRPWLVDFGSALQSASAGDPKFFQLTVGGPYHLTNDLSGIQKLKARTLAHMKESA